MAAKKGAGAGPGNAVKELVRKFALKNALDFGTAAEGAVLGKAIAANPSLKSDMAALSATVRAEVAEVNKLDRASIEKEAAKYSEEFKAAEAEKAEKSSQHSFEIAGAVMGKVITRFPPEPGGYIQIGNAKQCILSDELVRVYRGKIYLFFDDTNPEKCKQEYVDGIREDTKWLGINFSKEYYSSDYIEAVYDSGRRLLRQGDAYVCLCSAEDVKKNRAEKRECAHRGQDPALNLRLFEEMLRGKYDEQQAIVRLKGDMHSDNTTFRDPSLFRVKKTEHFRLGSRYVVWPNYHINTPVVDNINGITDTIRGKEYEIWDEINKKMLNSLGLKPPRMHYESMLKIEGTPTHKRVLRKLIKEGTVSGWDDPRLVTIASLRRRGIQPEAIRQFVLRFGMSKAESTVSMDMLLAENRKLIDPIARHMFFVKDPVKLSVKGAGAIDAKLRLHPSNDSGFREYRTRDVFYVSGDDASSLKEGDVVSLKDLLTVKIVSKSRQSMTASVDPSRGKVIHWVSDGNCVACSVLVPEALLDNEGNVRKDSLKVENGYVESYATRLNKGDIVQFERYGYCVLDSKENMRFILTSR
jgi:glutamyl-tRNA synthetase